MGLLKPESLIWADQIQNLKGQIPSERRSELKKDYNLSSGQITNLLNIKACFDPSAFDKVRQAARGPNPFTLSFSSAKTLVGLKDRVADLPTAVHAALDVILTRRLATRDIKKLVAWVISGKPASEFDPKTAGKPPKRGKTDKETGENQDDDSPTGKDNPLDLDLKKHRQLLEKAEAERIAGKETKEQEKLLAHIRKIAGSSPSKTGDKASSTGDDLFETVFQDWLADIPVITQIKSKVKKKKPITKGEEALLLLHKAGGLTGRGIKGFFKVFKPLFRLVHFIGKLVIEALKDLGLYKYAKAIFTLVMLVAALWFAWEAWRYGVMRPVEMVWSKIPWGQLSNREPVISASDVPPPGITLPAASPIVRSAELGSSKLKTSNSSLRTTNSTAVTYAPAALWMPAAENPKVLETEIASIPDNSRVEDSPVTLDEGMGNDLALSRLQDLTDADKYTMKIGNSTQKILSVNATINNLIINYKSTDLLGVFGGGGPVSINFFCEDIKAIHSSEIDVEGKNPVTLYQVTLIEEGAKIPLTIQCATAEDQQHLVSTMEYFIRNSRLGHDTALTGIPYPSQGFCLDEHWVNKLWAGSPMDKAGVKLGDLIWSLDKDTESPQDTKKMLTQLAAPGDHDLFIYSPANPDNGAERNEFHAGNFSPKRRKVLLTQ